MVSFGSISQGPAFCTRTSSVQGTYCGIGLPALHDDTAAWPLATLIDILENEEPEESTGQNTRNLFLEFIEIMQDSPLCEQMLAEATDNGWSLALHDLGGQDLYIDIPGKMIYLDNHGLRHPALGRSVYFTNTMILSLVRSLRDVWQEKRHGAFEAYSPESVLMLERVRAADNQALTIMACWELRQAGYETLWRHMLGLPESALNLIYAAALEKDALAVESGRAAAAIFHEWFRDPSRVAACDHAALEALDDMLAEGGFVFGTQKAGRICIEKLSCLPDRSAYLAGQGPAILGDPAYAGLGDPINQTHFLQIMRDSRLVYVENVAFRDADLARRMFPDEGHA